MANILITYISQMSDKTTKNSVTKYTIEDGPLKQQKITGILTNEAGIKYLQKSLALKNEKLDKIIALCTQTVLNKELPNFDNKTTIDYLKDTISDVDIVETSVSTSDSINDVTKIMELINDDSSDNKIYIDITGGMRDTVYTVTLIGRFCEFNNIPVEQVIYAQYNYQEPSVIKDFSANFRILDLLNSMSEFISFGSITNLANYFKNSQNSDLKALIQSMQSFTNSIILGKTTKLEDILRTFRNNIEKFKQSKQTTSTEQILLYMTDTIQSKFFSGKEIDYLSIINWCLDNNLIQQALTLYTEKIPDYLFNKNIISVSESRKNELANKKLDGYGLYYYVFYSDFMEPNADDNQYTNLYNFICEYSNCKNSNKSHKIVEKYKKENKSISKGIENFESLYKSMNGKSIRYNQNDIFYIPPSPCKEAWNYLRKHPSIVEWEKCNSHDFMDLLLGYNNNDKVANVKKETTSEKKFRFVTNFNSLIGLTKEKGYTYCISSQDMQKVVCDYFFFKSIRNEINHASDKDTLSDSQKAYYKALGYTTDVSVDSLIKDMKKSIDFISNLSDN